MQSWIIFTLLIVSVLSFDWSSLVLFPTPPPKNYPQRELEKSALEQIHHNRERKKDPPRIKSDVNCPDMGFAKYDHLMLVQYWPTTLCFLSVGQGSFCKVRHTKHEFNETYLIHGMWPINLNRRVRGKLFPQCCNNSITFNWDRDMVAHKEVQEMSDKYWPELLVPPEQLETHTKKHGIWSHEWLKHGTCFIEGDRAFATNIPQLSPVESYLVHAMRWREKYNFYNAFLEAGITPDTNKTYLVSDIIDVFTKKFGAKPELSCLVMKLFSAPVLYHVMMCTSKEQLKGVKDPNYVPKLANCSADVYDHSNYQNLRRCNEDELIMIPVAEHALADYHDLDDGTVYHYDPELQDEAEEYEDPSQFEEEDEDWDWEEEEEEEYEKPNKKAKG